MDIPTVACPISTSDLRLLEVLYTEDVILASDNHAVDIYISVKDFVASHN